MIRVAVYTGSFDPPTLGHIDIVRRAARLFDRLVIGVGANSAKSGLFSADERVALIREETADIAGTEVQTFGGLAVDFARLVGAQAIVRGLRSGSDLDYESQMAGMNAAMAPEVETIFLVAAPALAPITASLVRDVARAGGDVAKFVSANVARQLQVKART